jgi:hypothetical protein
MTRFKDTINGTDLLSYFKEVGYELVKFLLCYAILMFVYCQFCREKVLSLSKDNPTKYDVFAFDDSIYYGEVLSNISTLTP